MAEAVMFKCFVVHSLRYVSGKFRGTYSELWRTPVLARDEAEARAVFRRESHEVIERVEETPGLPATVVELDKEQQ